MSGVLPQLFVPHRSATQIVLPSLSMSTALVDPHARPSLAKPSIVLYGFGSSFVGVKLVHDCSAAGACAGAWACNDSPPATPAATTAPERSRFREFLRDIQSLLEDVCHRFF